MYFFFFFAFFEWTIIALDTSGLINNLRFRAWCTYGKEEEEKKVDDDEEKEKKMMLISERVLEFVRGEADCERRKTVDMAFHLMIF